MSELKSKIKRVSALKQRGKVLRETDPLLAVFQWGVNHMVRVVMRDQANSTKHNNEKACWCSLLCLPLLAHSCAFLSFLLLS
tara:strand:- start:188 stop:433 length:246 start_codon:yes stop_codon:yes gene_type:complete